MSSVVSPIKRQRRQAKHYSLRLLGRTHGSALDSKSARQQIDDMHLVGFRDENGNSLRLQVRQHLTQPPRQRGSQTLEWFVEQQHAPSRHQGSCQRDQFLLSPRKFKRGSGTELSALGHKPKNPIETLIGAPHFER